VPDFIHAVSADRRGTVTGRPTRSLPDRLLAVVEAAYLGGSPVAGHDDESRREIVTVTMRRWRSFSRRSAHHSRATLAARVEDLAKGLRDRFEAEPRLAGPLMEDYRQLAAELATALADVPAD
jgi:hypothetical protein